MLRFPSPGSAGRVALAESLKELHLFSMRSNLESCFAEVPLGITPGHLYLFLHLCRSLHIENHPFLASPVPASTARHPAFLPLRVWSSVLCLPSSLATPPCAACCLLLPQLSHPPHTPGFQPWGDVTVTLILLNLGTLAAARVRAPLPVPVLPCHTLSPVQGFSLWLLVEFPAG